MKQFTVNEDQSLKNFTDNTYAQASFCLTALLKAKEIKVNGKKVGSNVSLKKGDEVCYFLTPAQESREAFTIVYEDGNIIVADKDSGVNSEAVFAALSELGETYFIHRLDRNTRGLMVFAKSKVAEKELLNAFRERRVEKIYHAVVVGRMPNREEVLTARLTKDPKNALVHVNEKGDGEKIITKYRVLRETAGFSLLEITLHTGKTHQIRAHLAYTGHPVLGDMKYGSSPINRARGAMRQRLIAKSLKINGEGQLSYLKDKTFVSSYELELD